MIGNERKTAAEKEARVKALEVQRDTVKANLMQARARGDLDSLAVLESSLTTTQRLLEKAREHLRQAGGEEASSR